MRPPRRAPHRALLAPLVLARLDRRRSYFGRSVGTRGRQRRSNTPRKSRGRRLAYVLSDKPWPRTSEVAGSTVPRCYELAGSTRPAVMNASRSSVSIRTCAPSLTNLMRRSAISRRMNLRFGGEPFGGLVDGQQGHGGLLTCGLTGTSPGSSGHIMRDHTPDIAHGKSPYSLRQMYGDRVRTPRKARPDSPGPTRYVAEGVNLNEIVAYNFRRARELRGWTQEEAAVALEPFLGTRLRQAAVSSIEGAFGGDRRREFDAQELLAFACGFDLPLIWFFLPPPEDHRTLQGPPTSSASSTCSPWPQRPARPAPGAVPGTRARRTE